MDAVDLLQSLKAEMNVSAIGDRERAAEK